MNTYYYELVDGKSRFQAVSLPVFEIRVDLLVAGLGSGGSYCALQAASHGLSVLGAERGACVGGMSTQGVINGYYNGYVGGTYPEVDRETAESVGTVFADFYNHPDMKKTILERRLCEAGARLWFHTVVLGVYVQETESTRQVIGAALLKDGSIHRIGCRYLAEGTSDGHIFRILGVPGYLGRPTDGMTQPFSSVRIFRRPDGRLGRTNSDSGLIDPYNDEEFSRTIIIANGKHLKDSLPEKERFLYVSPQSGIREGMMMQGETWIRLEDILDETEWPDTLLCAYSDIDRHGMDHAFDDRTYQDWFVCTNLNTVAFTIRIPIRALIPKGFTGIFSTSRCISADGYASSAIRMNRDMFRLGEAAGLAVTHAIRENVTSLADVDYPCLRREIEALGLFIPEDPKNRFFVGRSDVPVNHQERSSRPVCWLTSWEQIKNELSTRKPGVALWSCLRLNRGLGRLEDTSVPIRELLMELLLTTKDDDRPECGADGTELCPVHTARSRRYHAAIALGLMDDPAAVPVLRELVRNRDEYFWTDNRRTNQLRGTIAICILGRLGDKEIVPELCSILAPEEYDRKMYHIFTRWCYKFYTEDDFNMVYYWFVSFAMAALGSIADRHPELEGSVQELLCRTVDDPEFAMRMSDGHPVPAGSPHDRLLQGMKSFVYSRRSVKPRSL